MLDAHRFRRQSGHTRGEGVLNLRAMAGIGEPALNYMNATGRLPAANDNGRLAAAIDRQTEAIERQTRVIMATGQVTGEQLAAIRASNAAMRDLTEQQLARA